MRNTSAVCPVDRLRPNLILLVHRRRLAAGAAVLDGGAARIAERLTDQRADSRRNRVAVRHSCFLGQGAACGKRGSGAQKCNCAHLLVSLLTASKRKLWLSVPNGNYCPVIFFCCSIAAAV